LCLLYGSSIVQQARRRRGHYLYLQVPNQFNFFINILA
jgi:hypothetical protein